MRKIALLVALLAIAAPAGAVALHRCAAAPGAWCGEVTRGPDGQRIGFALYAHENAALPARGTVLAAPDRAGAAATAGHAALLRLLAPLRADHDILLIDRRGTGRSGAIDCPALQRHADPASARLCAASLGARAWRYGTADAADDDAAVIRALGTGPVDFYGAGDGAALGEVLAARHPELLRSAVLDSPPGPPSPPEAGLAVALEKICRRDPRCAARGDTASDRLAALRERLNQAPVRGLAPDAHGHWRPATADADTLAAIAAAAGTRPTILRELDAAARALIEAADAAPLLRLAAEAATAAPAPPARFDSAGAALAARCADARHGHPPPVARPDLLARFAAPGAAPSPSPDAPALCAAWPDPPDDLAPQPVLPAGSLLPNAPALVLAGELDPSAAAAAGARATAGFARAYFVVLRNARHAAALEGGPARDCAVGLVARFIAGGGDPGDTACALQIPALRPVPRFAASWRDLEPGAPPPHTLARAAVATLRDVLARPASGAGLRGGRFHVQGGVILLDHVRWAADLAVSGAADPASRHAELALAAPGHAGSLSLAWSADGTMTGTGEIDGQAIAIAGD